jgi:hypothetical protein
LYGVRKMTPGDKYLEMALELFAKAANETNAVRRAGLEALAESYTHMGEQSNRNKADFQMR